MAKYPWEAKLPLRTTGREVKNKYWQTENVFEMVQFSIVFFKLKQKNYKIF